MICLVVPAWARRLHTRSGGLRAPAILAADAAAVQIGAPDAETRTPWPAIVRWREDAHVALLDQADALFQIMPKRAFAP